MSPTTTSSAAHITAATAVATAAVAAAPAGAHVTAGFEHVIALGDGTYVGFPTPCGEGRGCGNPLCTMSCIRRIDGAELLHWARPTIDITVVPKKTDAPAAEEVVLRALNLLGRDGDQLFSNAPLHLAEWCCSDEPRPLRQPLTLESVGWPCSSSGSGRGKHRSKVVAIADAAWLLKSNKIAGSAKTACPISGWPPRQPCHVPGEEAPYEAHLLLRWLECGVDLHPGSGRRIDNVHTLLKPLRDSSRPHGRASTPSNSVEADYDDILVGIMPDWARPLLGIAFALLLWWAVMWVDGLESVDVW